MLNKILMVWQILTGFVVSASLRCVSVEKHWKYNLCSGSKWIRRRHMEKSHENWLHAAVQRCFCRWSEGQEELLAYRPCGDSPSLPQAQLSHKATVLLYNKFWEVFKRLSFSFSCVSLYGEFSRNCKLITGFNDTSLFLQSSIRSTVYFYVKLNGYNPKVLLLACFVIMAGLRLLQLCGLMGPHRLGSLEEKVVCVSEFLWKYFVCKLSHGKYKINFRYVRFRFRTTHR
jgi:hypothetical protein